MAIGGWLYIQYPMVGLIAIMITLLFGGIPVFAALGLIVIIRALFLMGTDIGLSQIGPICIKALDNFTLLAVPLYIMGGQILVSSNVGKELFEVCSKWIGHWPGGSMLATIGACSIFAAISGSSVATAATIGIIAIPEMIKSGYRPSHAFGVVAAGGTLGILIPPSGTMIIYSMLLTSDRRFVRRWNYPRYYHGLFIRDICFYSLCHNRMLRKSIQGELVGEAGLRTKFVLGSLAPFIVIFGIYSGLLTPTEAAAVVVVYALIVGLIRRKIKISDLNGVLCTGTKALPCS